MDDARIRKISFAVLFVNAMLVLFWLLFNWHEERKATMPTAPSNLARVVFDHQVLGA